MTKNILPLAFNHHSTSQCELRAFSSGLVILSCVIHGLVSVPNVTFKKLIIFAPFPTSFIQTLLLRLTSLLFSSPMPYILLPFSPALIPFPSFSVSLHFNFWVFTHLPFSFSISTFRSLQSEMNQQI